MSGSEWIDFVKRVQREQEGRTFKEALVVAATRWKRVKGGKTWDLSPEQKKQYIEDKKSGKHQRKVGSMVVWDPTYEG